jgi:hypothetical protein
VMTSARRKNIGDLYYVRCLKYLEEVYSKSSHFAVTLLFSVFDKVEHKYFLIEKCSCHAIEDIPHPHNFFNFIMSFISETLNSKMKHSLIKNITLQQPSV